jgi:arsenate reductase-like glutaredoxin family protein
VQSASKEPVTADNALELLEGIHELLVAKGKKILRLDLRADRPDDGELLALLLGRSGKLRAPSLRQGNRLLVGYNADLMATLVRGA